MFELKICKGLVKRKKQLRKNQNIYLEGAKEFSVFKRMGKDMHWYHLRSGGYKLMFPK